MKKRRINPNSLKNLKPYPKGVSGNPGGRAKNDALAEIAEELFTPGADRDAIKRGIMARARKGDPLILKLLAERRWGKAAQKVEISGPDGGAVEVNVSHVRRKLVESLVG